jgi:hypothetical protein
MTKKEYSYWSNHYFFVINGSHTHFFLSPSLNHLSIMSTEEIFQGFEEYDFENDNQFKVEL